MKNFYLDILKLLKLCLLRVPTFEKAKSIGFFKGAPQNSNEQDSKIIIIKIMSKFNI
jgi:hypothetical protein